MPCKEAMKTEIVTIGPDATVAEAMKLLDEHHLRAIPVVNKDSDLLGLFDFNSLLNSLLPVSIPGMEGFVGVDMRLDNIIGAAPGIAKRLRKRMPYAVRDIMRRDVPCVYPDTPLWEGVRLLVKHHTILPVLEKDSNRLLGVLTQQSAMRYLLQLVEEQEKGPDEEKPPKSKS